MKKILSITTVFFVAILNLGASTDWIVPQAEADKISVRIFNKDMVSEGAAIYEKACVSCHGIPSKENSMQMVPPPGDPASKQHQDQKDGELFYRIKHGRAPMPGFGEVFSDTEIWFLIAYFRSFNKNYVQPTPDLTGIEMPEISTQLSYDRNVDKVIVKVLGDGKPLADAEVKAYVKGMFGDYLFGTIKTDEKGSAYIQFDPNLPGDADGDVQIIVKTTKGYAYNKTVQMMRIATPFHKKESHDLSHLWSSSPAIRITFGIFYVLIVGGIWAVIFYAIFKIIKIKKYSA